MCFAWEDEDMLAEGIERLAHVIRTLQDEQAWNIQLSMQPATETSAKDFW
jgi:hypothetical protein